MVADAETVRDRESRIRQYVSDLRAMGGISKDAFLQNRERQYAVLHALQLAIEASVEIATHICSSDALGIPSSYEKRSIYSKEPACSTRILARPFAGWQDSAIDSCTSTGTLT